MQRCLGIGLPHATGTHRAPHPAGPSSVQVPAAGALQRPPTCPHRRPPKCSTAPRGQVLFSHLRTTRKASANPHLSTSQTPPQIPKDNLLEVMHVIRANVLILHNHILLQPQWERDSLQTLRAPPYHPTAPLHQNTRASQKLRRTNAQAKITNSESPMQQIIEASIKMQICYRTKDKRRKNELRHVMSHSPPEPGPRSPH